MGRVLDSMQATETGRGTVHTSIPEAKVLLYLWCWIHSLAALAPRRAGFIGTYSA